jgi:integrase
MKVGRSKGGVKMWAAWRGWWRETGEKGEYVMRSVRLGDYEIANKERARIALDAYLAGRLPAREPDKKPLGKKGIYRVIVAAAKRAGINGVHPHVLRHSCATPA